MRTTDSANAAHKPSIRQGKPAADVLLRTVAYRPGNLREDLTEHYRRTHPEALGPPSR